MTVCDSFICRMYSSLSSQVLSIPFLGRHPQTQKATLFLYIGELCRYLLAQPQVRSLSGLSSKLP